MPTVRVFPRGITTRAEGMDADSQKRILLNTDRATLTSCDVVDVLVLATGENEPQKDKAKKQVF